MPNQRTLRALSLADRSDEPIANMIAKTIIEIYQTGVQDPEQICEIAMKQLAPRLSSPT
jgi:hypothetical protein